LPYPKHIYPVVWMFDCDDTLAIQGAPFPGPVILNDIMTLRNEGCITGICGNYVVAMKFFPDWYKFFSMYGPTKLLSPKPAEAQYKHLQLIDIRDDIVAARYVMVGNKRGAPGVRPTSQDNIQAKLAGWEFLSETEFARGKR
jgi:hypothetical protein